MPEAYAPLSSASNPKLTISRMAAHLMVCALQDRNHQKPKLKDIFTYLSTGCRKDKRSWRGSPLKSASPVCRAGNEARRCASHPSSKGRSLGVGPTADFLQSRNLMSVKEFKLNAHIPTTLLFTIYTVCIFTYIYIYICTYIYICHSISLLW